MRYHLIPVRIGIIKKITNVNKDVEKREQNPSELSECKLVQPLWKTVWRILKKLKIDLPYDLAILLLDIFLKKKETLI